MMASMKPRRFIFFQSF